MTASPQFSCTGRQFPATFWPLFHTDNSYFGSRDVKRAIRKSEMHSKSAVGTVLPYLNKGLPAGSVHNYAVQEPERGEIPI